MRVKREAELLNQLPSSGVRARPNKVKSKRIRKPPRCDSTVGMKSASVRGMIASLTRDLAGAAGQMEEKEKPTI